MASVGFAGKSPLLQGKGTVDPTLARSSYSKLFLGGRAMRSSGRGNRVSKYHYIDRVALRSPASFKQIFYVRRELQVVVGAAGGLPLIGIEGSEGEEKQKALDSGALVMDVEGMMCGGCAARVRSLLSADPSVESVAVNLLTETAAVRLHQAPLLVPELVAENLASHLTDCGFPTKRRQSSSDASTREKKQEKAKRREEARKRSSARVAFAWTLVALCCGTHATHWLHSVGIHFPMHGSALSILHNPLFKCGVSLTTLLGPARELIEDGAKAFLRKSPNMNSLVGFGACAAFLISAVSLGNPDLHWDASFFDEPVMLLAFVLLGRSLEENARAQAASDMQELLSLIPSQSRLVVLENSGIEGAEKNLVASQAMSVEIPTEQLRSGDVVLVLPGETLPIDGKVIAGRSAVDESMITGEPMPVPKTEGAFVSAGTVNWEGPVWIEATTTGSKSAIANIIKLVEEAQSREAPVQRMADSIAGPFAYTIMAASASTFVFWYLIGTELFPGVLVDAAGGPDGSSLYLSLKLAIDVLVVACPCALGLATPTAVLVGTSLGAKQGLLLRGGDVLERLAGVNAVIFDKTGTLTVGKPNVAAIATMEEKDERVLLQLAAAVEQHTSHPIASAIVREAKSLQLDLPPTQGHVTEPGYGALAYIDGKIVAVGSLEWVQGFCQKGLDGEALESSKKSLLPTAMTLANQLNEAFSPALDVRALEQSKTIVYVGMEGEGIVGAVLLTDVLRGDARDTVSRLQRMGIQALLLSGDREEAVAATAKYVGIERKLTHAGLKPKDKSNFVSQLQQEGLIVAMVGDGLNDAPALAVADVGMALKLETRDAVSDAASVILLRNQLSQVLQSINLSRATMNKVYQNLAWALAYNAVAIPLAAGALLPAFDFALSPSLAGGMMAMSSIIVVSNSLLLRLHRVQQ